MDVKEVEKKKKELEDAILKLIQKFEDETGCRVDDQGHILYSARNNFEPDGSISIPVHVA
jgi:hypothetical protein